MARISIRDLPDELHYKLLEAAAKHERSLESEIRFVLRNYVQSLAIAAVERPTHRENWQRQVGQRLIYLFTRLKEDDIFFWDESDDLPHLALMLGESSPSLLMDCVDGLAPLPFDLAQRIVNRFGCSLKWLLSGTGSIFLYPEIGNTYSDFIGPAVDNPNVQVKFVRICQEKADGSIGRHDGTLLMFRVENGKDFIAAGYSSSRFYLGAGMGSGGQGNLKRFVQYLNDLRGVYCEAYNFDADVDEECSWEHHPSYYLKKADRARWLVPLLNGDSPESIRWKE